MRWICLSLPIMAATVVSWVFCPESSIAQAPSATAYKETISGTKVAFEMLPIPGGKFSMGTADSETGRSPTRGRGMRWN